MSAVSVRSTAQLVLKTFRKRYPDAECSLRYTNPLQLLIATILSAQCTDVQVNKITPPLFAKYHTPQEFADAPIRELEDAIHTTGFFHNKAKNIQRACADIVEKFDGQVPNTLENLISLPGVGRKTANVVMSNAFGFNAGFVVDTHVFRISRRLGLAEGNTPEKVEQELMQVFPQKDWETLSHSFIQFGREICTARKPKCETCLFCCVCPSVSRS